MSYYFPDLIDGLIWPPNRSACRISSSPHRRKLARKKPRRAVRAGSQPGQTGDSQSELERRSGAGRS